MTSLTCPKVLLSKVHHEVKRMAERGFDIIYVGHEGHDEALGTLAQAPDSVTLVDPSRGLGGFSDEQSGQVALVAQTTLGIYEWQEVLDEASTRYPDLWTARKSDLCYATTNRQSAVEVLAKSSDVVLVVGSENSSNTQALVRVAAASGCRTHRVDGPSSIDPAWLVGATTVGITAGASAQDQSVRAVIDAVGPTSGVEIVSVTREGEYFPLPPQLRTLLGVLQSLVEGGLTARVPGTPGPLDDDRAWDATRALDLLGA